MNWTVKFQGVFFRIVGFVEKHSLFPPSPSIFLFYFMTSYKNIFTTVQLNMKFIGIYICIVPGP